MLLDSSEWESKLPLKPITRFAPSPTGYLHMGHVLSMAYVFSIAELVGAKVLLRIEDHDRQRCRKEYEQAILDDMAWLGFIPDNWKEVTQQGASDYRQSDRSERYSDILDSLTHAGHTYICGCSRKTVLSHLSVPLDPGQELLYPGLCRDKNLVAAEGYGLRLKVASEVVECDDLLLGMTQQEPLQQCGDYLLMDNHSNYTYNYAVVVDDMDQGVNVIIRGQDLHHCVGRQILLGKLLGRSEPPVFAHHPLVTDLKGQKLSKRALSEGVCKRRLAGEAAADVRGDVLWTAGLIEGPRPLTRDEMTCVLLAKGAGLR